MIMSIKKLIKYFIGLIIFLNMTLSYSQELMVNTSYGKSELYQLASLDEDLLNFKKGNVLRLSLEYTFERPYTNMHKIIGIEWKRFMHNMNVRGHYQDDEIRGKYINQSIGLIGGNRYFLRYPDKIAVYFDFLLFLDYQYSSLFTGEEDVTTSTYNNGNTIYTTEINKYVNKKRQWYSDVHFGTYFRLGAWMDISDYLLVHSHIFFSISAFDAYIYKDESGHIMDYGLSIGIDYKL